MPGRSMSCTKRHVDAAKSEELHPETLEDLTTVLLSSFCFWEGIFSSLDTSLPFPAPEAMGCTWDGRMTKQWQESNSLNVEMGWNRTQRCEWTTNRETVTVARTCAFSLVWRGHLLRCYWPHAGAVCVLVDLGQTPKVLAQRQEHKHHWTRMAPRVGVGGFVCSWTLHIQTCPHTSAHTHTHTDAYVHTLIKKKIFILFQE